MILDIEHADLGIRKPALSRFSFSFRVVQNPKSDIRCFCVGFGIVVIVGPKYHGRLKQTVLRLAENVRFIRGNFGCVFCW